MCCASKQQIFYRTIFSCTCSVVDCHGEDENVWNDQYKSQKLNRKKNKAKRERKKREKNLIPVQKSPSTSSKTLRTKYIRMPVDTRFAVHSQQLNQQHVGLSFCVCLSVALFSTEKPNHRSRRVCFFFEIYQCETQNTHIYHFICPINDIEKEVNRQQTYCRRTQVIKIICLSV